MMKKIFFLGGLVYSLCALSMRKPEVLLEVKGSGFFPTSNYFKNIYHNCGMIGGEITAQIYSQMYGWASIDWLPKSGRSIIGESKTKVRYLPIAFGLKFFVPFCTARWYLGGGAVAGRIHTHDESPFVAPRYTQWGWGGILKTGLIHDFSCSTFVDLFLNYSRVNARSTNTNGGTVVPHTAKVHGVMLGLGLGYRWN